MRESRYSTGDPELDGKLRALVNQCCTDAERRSVNEIATTALRLGIDCAKGVDLKIANAALKEMRRAFKMFTPFRRARKVDGVRLGAHGEGSRRSRTGGRAWQAHGRGGLDGRHRRGERYHGCRSRRRRGAV